MPGMLLRPCSGDSPSLAGNGKWSFTCANLTDKATTRRHLCSSKQPDTNLLLALTSSAFKVQPSVIGERQKGGGLIPACSLLCHTAHLTPCSSISIVLAYNTKHNAAGKSWEGTLHKRCARNVPDSGNKNGSEAKEPWNHWFLVGPAGFEPATP